MSRNLIGLLSLSMLLVACSSNERRVVYDYYTPAYRQLPPEPVYSRVMWSHLPEPLPAEYGGSAPLLRPVLSLDMPKTTFAEVLESLAITLGYQCAFLDNPSAAPLLSRSVSMKTSGYPEQLFDELGMQVGVQIEVDHLRRSIEVIASPGATSSEVMGGGKALLPSVSGSGT